MIMRFLGGVLMVGLLVFQVAAQTPKDQWVDSVYNTMDLNARIGQLFMVTVSPDRDPADFVELTRQIENLHVGGIVFEDGKTFNHAVINNQLQSIAQVPLLMAMHGSFASGTYADSLFSFPTPIMRGAITNDSLIFHMGKEVGRQMKIMGIHLQFIPANLSGSRNLDETNTYGENKFSVAAKTLSYWRGLQSAGILASAKYFPVQGVSVTNIERGLPSIQLTVDSTEVYPFKVLFRNDITAVMPAARDLPLFYSKKKTALRNMFSSGTLSASFAGDWIRRHMNYDGVIIIDVENMVRTSDKFGNGDAEVFAFRAGNDLLITSENINPAIRKMRRLLRREKNFLPILERSVKKILSLKYNAGLHNPRVVESPGIPKLVVTTETRMLREKMYRSAITAVSNKNNVLPIQTLDNKTFTCVVAGDSAKGVVFARQLSKYAPVSVVHVNNPTDTLMLPELQNGQHVIITAIFPKVDRITLSGILPTLLETQINRDVVICDFGSRIFREYAHEFDAVVTGYTDERPMLRDVAQAIFGGLPIEGMLPLTYGKISPGQMVKTPALDRLTYTFPEEAGIDSKTLQQIDSIAKEAIDMSATPGCYVLVARKGKVVYEKGFGHLTYEKQIPVTNKTVYDLASVTKVLATLQTVMFMHEKGLIDIYKKASVYLPELKNSNKEDFTIRDILTHQAGLWPFLPFWANTMKDTMYLPEYYSRTLSRQYPLLVSERLYASTAMKDSLWNWIVDARVREKPARTPFDYRYSDMGFYILHQLSEKLLNQPMHEFLYQNLYEPLGAYTTGYRPLLRTPLNEIAPTENDKLFRKTLLIGTVHDQGAAMLGGIAGHAGLFSNANDLAKIGQMLLQEGRYGGLQYYKPETVRLFTGKQFNNSRRGLGWDKPTGEWNSPTGIYASPSTFGHTGFTGTCVWVDPEFDLVYIFLSNRVHPDMTNNKLLHTNIRPRIQDVIYQAIFNFCKTADPKWNYPTADPVEALGSVQ